MTKKQRAKLGLILFPASFAVCLFIFWCVGIWPFYKIIQSRSWPEVDCVIDSCQVSEAGLSQGNYGNSVRYKVDVQYSYQFEGINFISTQLAFENGFFYSSKQQFSVQAKKTCYVNPNHPTEAVLFREYNFCYLFLSLITSFVLAVCCYGIYWCLKTLRAKHSH